MMEVRWVYRVSGARGHRWIASWKFKIECQLQEESYEGYELSTPSNSLGKLRMDKFNSHQRLGRQWILPPPDCCDNFFQSWKCREENILEKCDIQNSKCEIWKAGFSWYLEFVFHVSALMSYLKSFRVILSFSEQKPCSNTNTHTPLSISILEIGLQTGIKVSEREGKCRKNFSMK